MNILLLEETELDAAAERAVVTGRRLEHVRDVQGNGVGDRLCVGKLNGPIGSGRIEGIDRTRLELAIEWEREPPPPLPAALAVALPRPPILRRVLFNASMLGVKEIHLVAAARAHRSYWQSRSLQPDAIRKQLCLGLEQAVDTGLAEVRLHKSFRSFAEDFLPTRLEDTAALVAQQGAADACPRSVDEPRFLLVGPEGGWDPFELEAFAAAGVRAVDLGVRVLRVDTAVISFLTRLF